MHLPGHSPPVSALASSEQNASCIEANIFINRKCQCEPKSGTTFLDTCNLGPGCSEPKGNQSCYLVVVLIQRFPVTEKNAGGRGREGENPGFAFTHSFPKYLLSLYYIPNTVLYIWGELALDGAFWCSQNQKLPEPNSNMNKGACYAPAPLLLLVVITYKPILPDLLNFQEKLENRFLCKIS